MRVLLVEDERPLAALVARALEGEGVDVDVEHDGPAGLWRATEASYDVIVLDIMLPGKRGTDVCRELREVPVWTPVLMLTAVSGDSDEAAALDAGADDYLRKPFAFDVLMSRLRALARRGAPERPTTMEWGPLTLDPALRQASRDGREVALSHREYAVLEMLMRAQGQPVPARAILDRVWGFDASPESNVVQVYIRYLRQKIDGHGGDPLIDTVRGVGYRMAPRDDAGTGLASDD